MSITPYPLPREARQSAVLLGTGAATYGPFSFKIFDKEDVAVWMRAAGSDDSWLPQTVTVNKVANLPFDMFTVTFAAGVGVDHEFVVLGSRNPERTAGVLNGTRMDPNAVELEFSKIAAAFQELRRDVMGLNPVVGASDVSMGYALDRANHTGTQVSATISDLPVGVGAAVHGVDEKALAAADEIGILDSAADWVLRKTNLGKLLSWILPQSQNDFVKGLILSNSTVNAANAINIAAGSAKGNGKTFLLSADMGKRLDQTWVAGGTTAVPVGGLDAGSKVAGGTYHVHSIVNNTSGDGDLLFSLSATAPVVPAGWTRVQRVGAVLLDASGNIRAFRQRGNWMILKSPVDDYTGGQRAMSLLAITAPNGVPVRSKHSIYISVRTGSDSVVVATLADGDDSAATTARLRVVGSGIPANEYWAEGSTNAARQINASFVLTSGTQAGSHIVTTLGWEDYSIPRNG